MSNEQKKNYFAPEMKEIKLKNQAHLLQSSEPYKGLLSAVDSSLDKSDKA